MLSAARAATDGRRGHTKADRLQRALTHRPNKVHEVSRAIFRWAVGEGILAADPMAGMKRPIKRELPRDRVLTAVEIAQLWDDLRKARLKSQPTGGLPISRPTALAMLLSLTTGQRIGETSCIAFSELELGEAPAWTIPRERAKNREPHRVPLSRLALQLIREAKTIAGQDAKWLFPSPDGSGPIDPHAATRALARARPLMGVKNIRVHDLRRTAATRMEELGVRPHVIAHVLNHISVRMRSVTSRVYARYDYDQEKRAALNQWGEALEKIVSARSRKLASLSN
jgi:integrase